MTLLKSSEIPFGTRAKDFELVGTDGQTYSLASFDDAKALVVVFMCNHCPYIHRIWDELVSLQDELGDRGVRFVGINPNTINPEYDEETMDKMKEYYEKFSMNFPYLEDVDQSVARAYGAICTPDIFVYDGDKRLAYHGRVDNDELKSALLDITVGAVPGEDQIPSQGCSIKWVE